MTRPKPIEQAKELAANYRSLRIDMKPEHFDSLPVGEAVLEPGNDARGDH